MTGLPRAVVFDLDDTLADTAGTILEAAHRAAVEAMVRHGLRATVEEALDAVHEIRGADVRPGFLMRIVERFGAPDPEECHAASRRAFFGNPPDAIRLLDGARDVLERLRDLGIPTYLVTFGVPEAQARKLEVLGIRGFFEEVHVRPLETGADKTDVLGGILDRTGLAPEDVWVVGDRTPGEIRSGNLLGPRTIRVRVPHGEFAALEPEGPEEEPDETVDGPRALLDLL
jgi:putative hydrolase of the HAD superfamily